MKDHKLWSQWKNPQGVPFTNFEDYVENEQGLNLGLRKVQELIKCAKTLKSVGVPLERASNVGWSKVALISNSLTKDNAEELLQRAANTSTTNLRREFRPRRTNKKQANGSGDSASGKGQVLVLTPVIQEAMNQFAKISGKKTTAQESIEGLAQFYLDHCDFLKEATVFQGSRN